MFIATPAIMDGEIYLGARTHCFAFARSETNYDLRGEVRIVLKRALLKCRSMVIRNSQVDSRGFREKT
jgi:hypothetical protein